jgi:hypothetical protein
MWQIMWEQPKTLMMRLNANENQELLVTIEFIIQDLPIASVET